MKPDAIVFDIGNVILKFDYLVAARRLMEKNRLAEPPERETVMEIKNRYEGGLMSRTEFLERVRPMFRDLGPEEDFVAIWADIFELNEPMAAFIRQAADQTPLYLLSNIGCIHHEFIFDTYPVFQQFRGGVFSYQEGISKPSAEIYTRLLDRFSLNPKSTLYIDDLPANIEAGNAAGLQSLLYDHRNHDAFEESVSKIPHVRQPRHS